MNVALGRKLARMTTNIVVRNPRAWRIFRPLMALQFGELAANWDTIVGSDHLAPYERALEALPAAPAHALDLGTGTGAGALAIAHRFSDAQVVGSDLAPQMIEEARRKLSAELAGRVRFDVADASALPYADGSFDLVALANMIPFFDELARVLESGGHVLLSFSGGAETPIYVPFDRLRAELERRGFTEFAEFATGPGTSLLARKADRS